MVKAASKEAMSNLRRAFSNVASKPLAGEKNIMDVQAYLDDYSIKTKEQKRHGNSTLYILEKCLFNESHIGGEAAIGQTYSGKLFYQCFHDSCKAHTWHEARQIISDNDPLEKWTRVMSTPQCNESASLICASKIRPESVSWLWAGYIACGKIHIIAGPPGHGKTTLLLGLLATLTIGGRWPDGTQADVCDVALWSGEDGIADTLIPRLSACGADLDRVHIIDGVKKKGEQRSFDPAKDIPLLREQLKAKNIRMLVIDPIVSAVRGDSHKNAETRRSLQPVVDLAAELNCAVYGVTHFTKGTKGNDPVERVTGSLAFGALTRVVTVVMKLPENGNHPADARLFARAKSNIGPDGDGFYYFLRVVEVPDHEGLFNTKVEWGDPLSGSAKELIAKAEATGPDQGVVDNAIDWLRDILSEGPMAANDILKKGQKLDFSKSSLWRAKDRLGVKSVKDGSTNRWVWIPPKELIQPDLNSSGQNGSQAIDYNNNRKNSDPEFLVNSKEEGKSSQVLNSSPKNHEEFKDMNSSVKPIPGKGLGMVEPPKIPHSVLPGGSWEQVSLFPEDKNTKDSDEWKVEI